ncbi:MAG TPA: toprim domain-containing protein, partial [Acidimicrobiia bacterium]
MAKPLVIVESGAKAKTIAGFLGADRYTVMASVGHIRDLPRGAKEAPKSVTKPEVRRLGIDVDDHFAPVYVVPDDKKRVVAELKAALKDASELYLATDEDREGEAISWHLLEVLKPQVPVKRMVFHEITNEAIADAIDNWRDLDMKLVEAQEGRRVLDRLVGFEVSNVAFRRIGPGTSAGRVQSVATRLVVDRERARMAFRSGSYWDLEGTFAAGDEASSNGSLSGFPASLVS